MAWQDPYDPYGKQPYQQQPGQYGQTTPGWQDPYPQYGSAPGWQDPYAQYGPQYPAIPVPAPVSNGLTVVALIANIATAMFTCGIGLTWLPGIILSAMALGRYKTDPESARRLTLWAWVCFALDIALTVGFYVLIFSL
jgi:hypothetical protein